MHGSMLKTELVDFVAFTNRLCCHKMTTNLQKDRIGCLGSVNFSQIPRQMNPVLATELHSLAQIHLNIPFNPLISHKIV